METGSVQLGKKRELGPTLDPDGLAHLLGLSYDELKKIIYDRDDKEKYYTFIIKKKNGNDRVIEAPCKELKQIQYKLKEILTPLYKPKPSVHSFVENRSIKTNAKKHAGKRYVLNLDLENFFHSITFKRVRGMFMAIPYNLPYETATVIAHICCYRKRLPQGSPISPLISNMICRRLDNELQQLAKECKCYYTRYADDITFSTDQKSQKETDKIETFPARLATISDGQARVGYKLKNIIESNGFKVNEEKVRLQRHDQRQLVTGLVVNKTLNVRRKYKNQIRAMIHALEKYGLEKAEEEFRSKWYNKHRHPSKKPISFKDVLRGKLAFLGMICGKDHPFYIKCCQQIKKVAPYLINYETELEKLLREYRELKKSDKPHGRGNKLEDLFYRLLALSGIETIPSYKTPRNEQIDGGFILEGKHFLVECKWWKDGISRSETDVFDRKLQRTAKDVRGLFLSIHGWSDNALWQSESNLMFMDHEDLEYVLEGKIDLKEFLIAKNNELSFGNKHYSAKSFLRDKEAKKQLPNNKQKN
jgi:RNA-directed DNA polymerase